MPAELVAQKRFESAEISVAQIAAFGRSDA